MNEAPATTQCTDLCCALNSSLHCCAFIRSMLSIWHSAQVAIALLCFHTLCALYSLIRITLVCSLIRITLLCSLIPITLLCSLVTLLRTLPLVSKLLFYRTSAAALAAVAPQQRCLWSMWWCRHLMRLTAWAVTLGSLALEEDSVAAATPGLRKTLAQCNYHAYQLQ